ncbi:MAG: alpha/beta hydrolase [Candidatus Omnitrophica bacterium]|nr:alpha/beta hydrolase [Candidatus Omnitrophota bacterium]
MPYIRTERGVNLFYNSAGEGKPLIFLHGFAVDSSIWREQIGLLAPDFRAIAVDLPGHGRSEWKQGSLKDMVEDALSLYPPLKIKKADIIAHSFAGLIGIKLAAEYPRAVNKLVLVSSTPKFIRDESFDAMISLPDLEKLRGLIGSEYPGIIPVFLRSVFTAKEREDGFKAVPEHTAKRESLEGFLEIIRDEDARSGLNEIKAPVLIISGSEDPLIGEYSAKFLQGRISASRLEMLAGCGHFPFLTRKDDFYRRVKEFLADNG